MQQTIHVVSSCDIPACWTCVWNIHRHSSSTSKGTCIPCFQTLCFVHQDEICSCIVTGIHSEGQSAQPVEAEEEAQEPQDGSLWWHGMFIRAGRMGNMASDVRPDGQEQGKKVPNAPFFIHLLTQSTTILSFGLIRGVRRHLLGKQHTSSMAHVMIMISAVNNSFISSLPYMCCPLGSGTSSLEYLPAVSQHSHANVLHDLLIQLMCLLGISAGVCHSLPSLVDHLIPVFSEWLAPCRCPHSVGSYFAGNLAILSGLSDLCQAQHAPVYVIDNAN